MFKDTLSRLFRKREEHIIPGKKSTAGMSASDFKRLPKHVAIIMDGNGRWAKRHRLAVSKGHRQGTENLREIIRHTDDLGIHSLSLYAFFHGKLVPAEGGSRCADAADSRLLCFRD